VGFFGHLVFSAADITALWKDATPDPGNWVGDTKAYRIFDRFGEDWRPVEDFHARLREQVTDGFIAASIWDGDGALLIVGVPGRPEGPYWLNVDGVIGHFLPPWAPFDETGNRLSPEAEAEQDAEWKVEADQYREELLAMALSTDRAAHRLIDWARLKNLQAGSASNVASALNSSHVFVEDTIAAVLTSLGALQVA
jgi:hypothetical protein